jgi:uncharacterized protein (DUF302 family)
MLNFLAFDFRCLIYGREISMRAWIQGVLFLFVSVTAQADSGLVDVKSVFNVTETANRLVRVLNDKGMKVFARINHAKGAESVGKKLRPTELLIFGNPKVGAPLMQCAQLVAIDLPQKALVWEDKTGQVWLSYNDPAYLSQRHDLQACEPVLAKVSNALKSFAHAATKPE